MSFVGASSLKEKAVDFFIREEVIKFGDFTLKSGKKSPYYFNTGTLCTGHQLQVLGTLYAEKFRSMEAFHPAEIVFGSAYKGIPIAVSTAIALAEMGHKDIRAVSDRKEAKTHGDAGNFLGRIGSGDKAVIVDDVIATGGTKIEALEKLREIGCTPLGFIIAFDRMEPAEGSMRTSRELLEESTGLPVYALCDIFDIAKVKPDFAEVLKAYRAEMGQTS